MQSQEQDRTNQQRQAVTNSTSLSVVDARFERDVSGFNRHVYRLSDGTEVFFRGREEVVALEGRSGVAPLAVGSRSNWLASPSEPSSVESLIEATRENGISSPTLISASKTLSGVLEVAYFLSPENREIQQLRDELGRGVYSERAYELLDELVACNLFGKSGLTGDESQAEMLVIEGLLGGDAAKQEIARRMESFSEFRSQSSRRSHLEPEPGQKALRPSELACVHATRFLPEMREDGTAQVSSLATATDHQFIRNTVHVALNHCVSSHMYGSWEDCSYVLIAPFESVTQQSGNPYMLNTVDTWWTLNPGEPLVFPEAHLIILHAEAQERLFDDSEPHITRVKAPPYTERDLYEFEDEIWEHDSLRQLLSVDRVQRELRREEAEGEKREGEKLTSKENELLSEVMREVATARALCRAGYTPRSGGMWAWDGNSWEATAETTELAARMKVFSGNHSDSRQAGAERILAKSLGKVIGMRKRGALVDDSGKIPTPVLSEEAIQELPPETLRSLYEGGVFFGRCSRGEDQ